MPEETSDQAYVDFMQKQQENEPNVLYADSLREDKVKNIIAQIDPSNLLTEIEHRLRGEKFNPITQGWDSIDKNAKDSKPISEKLVSRFVSFLGAVLNQNTTLSNYSIHEVNNRMNLVIDYITDDLSDNDAEYGLEGDYTEMTRIGMIICETVSSVFRRALNGMESKRIFSALRVTESLVPAKSGGLKEAFKFW